MNNTASDTISNVGELSMFLNLSNWETIKDSEDRFQLSSRRANTPPNNNLVALKKSIPHEFGTSALTAITSPRTLSLHSKNSIRPPELKFPEDVIVNKVSDEISASFQAFEGIYKSQPITNKKSAKQIPFRKHLTEITKNYPKPQDRYLRVSTAPNSSHLNRQRVENNVTLDGFLNESMPKQLNRKDPVHNTSFHEVPVLDLRQIKQVLESRHEAVKLVHAEIENSVPSSIEIPPTSVLNNTSSPIKKNSVNKFNTKQSEIGALVLQEKKAIVSSTHGNQIFPPPSTFLRPLPFKSLSGTASKAYSAAWALQVAQQASVDEELARYLLREQTKALEELKNARKRRDISKPKSKHTALDSKTFIPINDVLLSQQKIDSQRNNNDSVDEDSSKNFDNQIWNDNPLSFSNADSILSESGDLDDQVNILPVAAKFDSPRTANELSLPITSVAVNRQAPSKKNSELLNSLKISAKIRNVVLNGQTGNTSNNNNGTDELSVDDEKLNLFMNCDRLSDLQMLKNSFGVNGIIGEERLAEVRLSRIFGMNRFDSIVVESLNKTEEDIELENLIIADKMQRFIRTENSNPSNTSLPALQMSSSQTLNGTSNFVKSSLPENGKKQIRIDSSRVNHLTQTNHSMLSSGSPSHQLSGQETETRRQLRLLENHQRRKGLITSDTTLSVSTATPLKAAHMHQGASFSVLPNYDRRGNCLCPVGLPPVLHKDTLAECEDSLMNQMESKWVKPSYSTTRNISDSRSDPDLAFQHNYLHLATTNQHRISLSQKQIENQRKLIIDSISLQDMKTVPLENEVVNNKNNELLINIDNSNLLNSPDSIKIPSDPKKLSTPKSDNHTKLKSTMTPLSSNSPNNSPTQALRGKPLTPPTSLNYPEASKDLIVTPSYSQPWYPFILPFSVQAAVASSSPVHSRPVWESSIFCKKSQNHDDPYTKQLLALRQNGFNKVASKSPVARGMHSSQKEANKDLIPEALTNMSKGSLLRGSAMKSPSSIVPPAIAAGVTQALRALRSAVDDPKGFLNSIAMEVHAENDEHLPNYEYGKISISSNNNINYNTLEVRKHQKPIPSNERWRNDPPGLNTLKTFRDQHKHLNIATAANTILGSVRSDGFTINYPSQSVNVMDEDDIMSKSTRLDNQFPTRNWKTTANGPVTKHGEGSFDFSPKK